jgi:beta-lactamase regulating signal transducer with metallopeptidase domain/HEAT repeat protein
VNHFIDAALEPGLWRLADWSLRWALLIGLFAGALLLLRPRRAATRSLAGWLVLLGGLLLPALPHWGPPLTLPRAREEAPALAAEPLPLLAKVAAARPVEPVAGPVPPPQGGVAPAQPFGARRLAILTLAVLWATGVILLLVRLLGGWLLLTRLRPSAVPLDGAAAELFAACRAQVGLRRAVALAAHPAVGSPVTLGLFRPVVLVPPDWLDLDEPARRASLLHELAHLARRDDWAALLFELVRTAFFFHPGVRWLLARLECERELLCDEAALAGGLDARSYARMLVDFSRRCGRLLPAPLAASTHPLRIGGRRTVTVRIHHLLEENMKQWLSPTPRWQALTLGLVVLGLAVVLGSFRVGAGEPPITLPNDRYLKDEKKEADPPPAKEEPAAVKKEALRYGGKSFDQWRTELVTELKPDIRIDGIKALREFGANGYGPDATAAILQVMQGYDINGGNKDDEDVFKAGLEAVRKIGKPSVTVLIGGVRGDNRNGRRFAVNALGQLDSDAQAAAPALIKAMRDEDAYTRERAADAVFRIQPEAPGYAAALAGMLKDDLPSLRANAACFLGNAKLPEGRALTVPALMEALDDPDANVRLAVISALVNIKPPAREVVPGVAKRLTDNFSTVQRHAFEIINAYGPEAKAAVPALIAIARDSSASNELRLQAIGALGQIGPNAREAVPVLKKLLEEKALNSNFHVDIVEPQNSIQKALEKIGK